MTGAAALGVEVGADELQLARKVSTSAGEKETVTSTLPPGGMTPCAGDAEKGASAPAAARASRRRRDLPPVGAGRPRSCWSAANECERTWNIIVGLKASDVASHSTAAYAHLAAMRERQRRLRPPRPPRARSPRTAAPARLDDLPARAARRLAQLVGRRHLRRLRRPPAAAPPRRRRGRPRPPRPRPPRRRPPRARAARRASRSWNSASVRYLTTVCVSVPVSGGALGARREPILVIVSDLGLGLVLERLRRREGRGDRLRRVRHQVAHRGREADAAGRRPLEAARDAEKFAA